MQSVKLFLYFISWKKKVILEEESLPGERKRFYQAEAFGVPLYPILSLSFQFVSPQMHIATIKSYAAARSVIQKNLYMSYKGNAYSLAVQKLKTLTGMFTSNLVGWFFFDMNHSHYSSLTLDAQEIINTSILDTTIIPNGEGGTDHSSDNFPSKAFKVISYFQSSDFAIGRTFSFLVIVRPSQQ